MLDYTSTPTSILRYKELVINSFIGDQDTNLDLKTVQSFGEEWSKFNQFNKNEIEQIGKDYFDIADMITSKMVVLDIGCGSGRWTNYLSPRVKFIEAIDPSHSVYFAAKCLSGLKNTRVTHASVNHIPFQDNSFDFVFSLGVLHHLPDTFQAIQHCYTKTKSGGWFLLYLYYNLENRGIIFRSLFNVSTQFRKVISSFPSSLKHLLCELIAGIIYWPLAKFSLLVSFFSEKIAKNIPLSYYRKTSFFIMRNDALDRFGTPLEKRFSKKEITEMLSKAGFIGIRFSPNEPFWHVIAQKP